MGLFGKRTPVTVQSNNLLIEQFAAVQQAAVAETPPKMRQMLDGFDSVAIVSTSKFSGKFNKAAEPEPEDGGGKNPAACQTKARERGKRLRCRP